MNRILIIAIIATQISGCAFLKAAKEHPTVLLGPVLIGGFAYVLGNGVLAGHGAGQALPRPIANTPSPVIAQPF